MDLSAPSWDLFITLFFVITIGYGFLLQREKIVVTMVAAYAGIAIAQLFWPDVYGFFHGENSIMGRYFIRANFTEPQIQIGLFLLTTVLVSAKGSLDAERGRGWLSPLEVIVLSGLTGALIMTTILGYMPAENTGKLAEQSKLVGHLVKHHDLLTIGPILILVGLGLRDGGRRRYDE